MDMSFRKSICTDIKSICIISYHIFIYMEMKKCVSENDFTKLSCSTWFFSVCRTQFSLPFRSTSHATTCILSMKTLFSHIFSAYESRMSRFLFTFFFYFCIIAQYEFHHFINKCTTSIMLINKWSESIRNGNVIFIRIIASSMIRIEPTILPPTT